MKGFPIFLAGIIVVLFLNGCHNSKKDNSLVILTDSIRTEEPSKVVGKADPFNQLRDTLIGKFDGIHLDTLIMEPSQPFEPLENDMDIYHTQKWHIYTKNGTVKEMKFDSYKAKMKIIAEGDLDGDGKDEWGFIPYYPTSNFVGYHVFKNKKGEWHEIIEPLEIWLPHIEADDFSITLEDLVQPSIRKGYLKVKFSKMNENATEFTVVDSIIKIIN